MSDWRDELGRWLAPFMDRFGHKARRRMCPLYVAGLIGPGDRKSVGPMAERVAPGDYDQLHHFMSDGIWDEAPLERELAIQADKLVGGAGAFLVIDDTTLPKKGTHSVGVAPQYASRPRKRHVPNVLSASAEDMLTQAKWRTLAWRKGTKGPLKARFAAVRVRVADGPPQRIGDKGMQHMPGDEVWLVGERRASGEQKYYLANLPADTDLRTLAATIKARWVCEQAHQQLKEELGLDHFEGRSWQGLHRHALMAMIAYAFLQHRRLAAASGEKKNRPRAASANAAGHTKSHRRSPGARSTLPMPALPPANPQIARIKSAKVVLGRVFDLPVFGPHPSGATPAWSPGPRGGRCR